MQWDQLMQYMIDGLQAIESNPEIYTKENSTKAGLLEEKLYAVDDQLHIQIAKLLHSRKTSPNTYIFEENTKEYVDLNAIFAIREQCVIFLQEMGHLGIKNIEELIKENNKKIIKIKKRQKLIWFLSVIRIICFYLFLIFIALKLFFG